MNNLKSKYQNLSGTINLLISRTSGLLSNGVLILFIPNYLDSVSQGYYFSFLGLSAIQVAFDFGMSQAVMQMAIHAYAVDDFGRVRALIKYSNKWFIVSAIFFVLAVLPCGIYYFNDSHQSAPWGWGYIWSIFIILSGFNMFFSSKLVIIEGLGALSSVAKLKLFQNLIGILFVCLALYFGLGLLAIVIMPAVSALLAYIWLKHIYIFKIYNESNYKFTREHKREIFNLRWRIGLSWIFGYVVQQSITPVIFREQGAVIAGQFGLTLALFNAISIVSLSWVAAHAPSFSSHASLLQQDKLETLFKRSISQSIACTIFLICLLVVILEYSKIIPSDRVLGGIPLLSLAIVCLANSIIFPIAVVLRAHKAEPTLLMGFVTGILIISLILYTSKGGVGIISIGYASATALVALPWTVVIYFRFLKKYYER